MRLMARILSLCLSGAGVGDGDTSPLGGGFHNNEVCLVVLLGEDSMEGVVWQEKWIVLPSSV